MSDVVDRVLELVRDNYLFPDIAEQIDRDLGKRDYSRIIDPDELAATLTRDLREVSKDKHLLVVHLTTLSPSHPTTQANLT